MNWTFLVTSENQPRVQSRIFQILDHQRISVQAFASFELEDELRVSFEFEAEPQRVGRIEALLRKLQGVLGVEAFPMDAGLTRTIGLFKVMCDQVTRLEILQVVAALEVRVLTIQPLWMVIEAVGTRNDIESMERILCPYGLVQSFSVASVGVHGFESPRHPHASCQPKDNTGDPSSSDVARLCALPEPAGALLSGEAR